MRILFWEIKHHMIKLEFFFKYGNNNRVFKKYIDLALE